MSLLVVLPGQVGPPRRLVDVLRDRHEGARERYRLEAAFREGNGAPFGEDIDVEEERKRLASMQAALDDGDLDLVRLGHVAGLAQLSALPQDPGEFAVPRDLEGVSLTYRYLPARVTQALRQAWQNALESNDAIAIEDAEMAIVSGTIDTVTAPGVDGPVTLRGLEMQALRDAGVMPWMLSAALHLQRLPSGKAWRSGGLPLPT